MTNRFIIGSIQLYKHYDGGMNAFRVDLRYPFSMGKKIALLRRGFRSQAKNEDSVTIWQLEDCTKAGNQSTNVRL